MVKHLKIIGILMVFLTVFTGTANAFEGGTVKVRLSIDGAAGTYIDTEAATVEEFLAEQGLELGDSDIVEPDADTAIEEFLQVNVTRSFSVYLCVDGAPKKRYIEIETTPCTILEFVKAYEKSSGAEFRFDSDLWATELTPDMVVELSSVKAADFTMYESVPFETENVEDHELEVGVEVVDSEGHVGEKTIVTRITYVAGEEIAREVVSDELTTEPESRVIRTGTLEPEPEPENVATFGSDVFEYDVEYTMTATAYTDDYNSTGKNPGDPGHGITASGMRAAVGVVAVDPTVIPLHTQLYIEGYGYAVAGDTGGAIKGNKVDLFFNTHQEAMNYGRRTIKVYVLAE